jgi:hypothetical protein
VLRRLQSGCIGGEITDVGPIENFDWSARAGESGRCKTAPEALKTHVRAGDAPVAGGFDDLHVVNTDHSFAVYVDQLFVEHVAGEQYFAFAANERAEIEDVGVEANAVLVEFGDAPAREEEVAAPVTRDETRDGRMIVLAKTDDHVLHRGDTFTFQIAYRAT